MLDLHRLRLLREVHVRGTLHAAAAALGYTTSAVSQQLAVLEKEAGTPLLERVGRNVRLTDAGLVLVRHADDLLDRVEAAEADVAAVAAGRVAGVVRVAAFQSAFIRLVAPAIRSLATTYPDLRIEATEAEVEQSTTELRLHRLDLLIGDEYDGQPRPVHPEFQRDTLLRERMNLVLPADHPKADSARVRLRQLGGTAWACSQPGTGHHRMHAHVCRELGGFEPDLRYTSDDFLIQLEMVRGAGAAALLPDLALGYTDASVVVRPLEEGAIGREVFLFTRRGRTPAVAAVVAALTAAVATTGPGTPPAAPPA